MARSEDPVADLQTLIAGARPTYDEPLTAALADESEPEGPVVIRDRHGFEVMRMARATYEALRPKGSDRA